MRGSLLALSLLAAIPALTRAQDPKLVNCRTLEEAGHFVGPDEVIVDDKVCQKARSTADAAKAQPPKPLNGATISDTTASDNVVDAAKTAGKRAAARKEKEDAEARKNTADADPSAAPTARPSAPQASLPSEPPASKEIVITFTPSSAPVTTSPATERKSIPPAEVVTAPAPPPTAAPPVTPPASARAPEPIPVSASDAAAPPLRRAEALPPPDPTHPATSSGFYDANAPKRSANTAPQTNSGFATADQVNAGLKPGATTIPPASSRSAADDEAAAPAPEAGPHPQHTTVAASRVPFDDPDRDRSVKVGDFAQPKDVAPDPDMEHRSAVDPSDVDGFQDRQRPECTKNITLGGLQGEKLVLGVPIWAAKWIQKNQSFMPQICFSETPMKTALNYLIVFSTPAGAVGSKGTANAVLNTDKSSAARVGAFTTSFGSTWHYSYDRNVGTTVLTQDEADEPHGQPGQVLYATVYTENGVPVSQRWPGQVKRERKLGEKNPKKLKAETEALERVSSDLLSQLVEDIQKF
jgi:hypothetical protein